MHLRGTVDSTHGGTSMQSLKPKIWLNPEFLEQVIKNDIPHEELDSMNFHSPISYDHFDPTTHTSDPSDFHSEEYLEYRRRVFEELASEYGKQQSQHDHAKLISDIPGEYHELDGIHFPLSPAEDYHFSDVLHTREESSGDACRDLSPLQQIAWDDSDLHMEPLIAPPLLKMSQDKSTDGIRTNLLVLSDDEAYQDKATADDSDEDVSRDTIPSMHWTELEKQLKVMTRQHEDQEKLKKETAPSQAPFSPKSRKSSAWSHLQKQKNDRQAILQKLSTEDSDTDNFQYGSTKPWYNPRLERGNSQNLQICYINESCSSSDSDENARDSKSLLSSKAAGKPSPASSPALPSPGFGMRRNMLYRLPSSSSTVSVSSTSSASHHNSSSSLPGDGEIINIRSSINTDDVPKVRTTQERLEFQARVAITHAHQEAKRLAVEERKRTKKEISSFEKLAPLDDITQMQVKTRTLSKTSCDAMAIGQLQVILNTLHTEKEALNSELKTILEIRDELRTEQDAKLMDVDDMKAMLAATGPETTV